MTLPVWNNNTALSLSQIQGEFGGTSPISLSEYYAAGGLTPSGTVGYPGGGATAIPTGGEISIGNFFGSVAWVRAPTSAAYVRYGSQGALTVTVPKGVTTVSVWLIAGSGGGGGGGGAGEYQWTASAGGGGGGSGGVGSQSVGVFNVSEGATFTVTPGASGAGGAGGTGGWTTRGNGIYDGWSGTDGGRGGDSSIYGGGVSIGSQGGSGGKGGAGAPGDSPNALVPGGSGGFGFPGGNAGLYAHQPGVYYRGDIQSYQYCNCNTSYTQTYGTGATAGGEGANPAGALTVNAQGAQVLSAVYYTQSGTGGKGGTWAPASWEYTPPGRIGADGQGGYEGMVIWQFNYDTAYSVVIPVGSSGVGSSAPEYGPSPIPPAAPTPVCNGR